MPKKTTISLQPNINYNIIYYVPKYCDKRNNKNTIWLMPH